MIKKVGEKGSGIEELKYPRQPAISPNQHLYVADQLNDRLQILTTDFEFTDTLQHQAKNYPVDVKFSDNEMFLLSIRDSPCVHVFTLLGEKTRSIVTRGDGMQVGGTWFSVWMDRITFSFMNTPRTTSKCSLQQETYYRL